MSPTKFWRQVDWFSVFLVILLVTIGWVNIYAAVFDNEKSFNLWHYVTKVNAGKQLIFISFAVFIAWFIFLLDMRFFSKFAYGVYGISIFSLILVLIFGKEIAGARAWFDFGLFKIQPAEFAKYATALVLARFMGRQNIKVNKLIDFLQILGLLILPAILILMENETGSVLIFGAFGIMLYREGLPNVLVVSAISVVVVIVSTLIMLENISDLLTWILILSVGSAAVMLLGDLWQVFVNFAGHKKGQMKQRLLIFLEIITLGLFAGLIYWWNSNLPNNTDVNLTSFINQQTFFQSAQILFGGWLLLLAFVWLMYKYQDEKFEKFFITGGIGILFVFAVIGADFFIKDVLHDYQQTRLQVLVNPNLDPRGAGYQVTQSKIAIGSGGLTGKGFLQGTQTKLDFIPDQSTDFIFCTIGEEYGFLGSLVLIAIFITLMVRLVNLAERQKSRFSRVYAYSVVGVLLVHFLVNIGMTIGLFPVIGIPLPFISYGGSSLWGFTLLIFTALKLDAHRKQEVLS